MLQAIYTLSVLYPHQYWAGVILSLLGICYGWYRLGVTRLAVAGAMPARPRLVVHWRSRPFVHGMLFQIAGVSIIGRLESTIDSIGVSVAIRFT